MDQGTAVPVGGLVPAKTASDAVMQVVATRCLSENHGQGRLGHRSAENAIMFASRSLERSGLRPRMGRLWHRRPPRRPLLLSQRPNTAWAVPGLEEVTVKVCNPLLALGS